MPRRTIYWFMEIRNIENSKTKKKEQEKPVVTRAEKANRMKGILRELLGTKDYKWNELLDSAAKAYAEKFPGESDDMNDLKGKMGSVFSLMEDAGETRFEAGVCSLVKAEKAKKETSENPTKDDSVKAEKNASEKAEKTSDRQTEEKQESAKKAAGRRGRKPAAEKAAAPEISAASAEEKAELSVKEKKENPVPKKRGRKPKSEKQEEKAEPIREEAKTPADSAAPAPKKRGRKPKPKTPVESPAVPVPSKDSEQTLATEPAKAENEPTKVEINAGKAESVNEARTVAQEETQASVLVVPAEKEAEIKEEIKIKEEGREEMKAEEPLRNVPAVKPEAKVAPVFDMTLLFGSKGKAPALKKEEKKEAVLPEKTSVQAQKEEKALSEERRSAERTLQPVVAKMQEPKKSAVMPEFAFLGNASVKSGTTPAQRDGAELRARESVRPAPAPSVARAADWTGTPSLPSDKPQTASAAQVAPAKKQPVQLRETTKAEGQGSGNGTNGRKNGARRGRGREQTSEVGTPEEALKAEFLKKLRSLGGDYFEYYSVYLLERYSLRNGRRLEGLRVSGGERDGGIDGEIELTDKFGFRETIYIQSKNWDPSKGDLEKWVVGETLLQQFIGAVTCRLAKEGKQHSRGIFITTSHFTPEAKSLLETMSDRFIGYDSDDVFEAAKECSFGLLKKDGEWVLDEELLSGGKAFFNLM